MSKDEVERCKRWVVASLRCRCTAHNLFLVEVAAVKLSTLAALVALGARRRGFPSAIVVHAIRSPQVCLVVLNER